MLSGDVWCCVVLFGVVNCLFSFDVWWRLVLFGYVLCWLLLFVVVLFL